MRKSWDNTGNGGAGSSEREDPHFWQNRPEVGHPLKPVPKTLRVGTVTISPATVLAPMAGVTDTVFRRFIRNLGGCGLIMTEFTSADGVLRAKDKKAKGYLHFYEDEHPISAQLFGSDPQVMADAARIVEGHGFALVHLNLGCPAKQVAKYNGGSAPSNPWIFRQIEQYCARVATNHVGPGALTGPASNSHVGIAAPGCPVERKSTVGIEGEAGTFREGHNFATGEKNPIGVAFGKGTTSVVPISLPSSSALAAEGSECGVTDELATSGAKAP